MLSFTIPTIVNGLRRKSAPGDPPGRVPQSKKRCAKGFVDYDHDAGRVFVVFRFEIASGEKRHPQHIEVAGRHRGVMHAQVLAAPCRIPLDDNVVPFP